MSRFIDADEIVYFNDTREDRPIEAALVAYKGQIDRIPSADVAPVVHGHWIEEPGNVISCRCSICGHSYNLYEDDINGYPYCAWCGAKMDEKTGGGNRE